MRNRIEEITVATRHPSGRPGDLGSCEVGFFTIDNDLLSLVEADGTPVRKANGDRETALLRAGESARTVASRLILAHWRATNPTSDFNRPLRYGPLGGY